MAVGGMDALGPQAELELNALIDAKHEPMRSTQKSAMAPDADRSWRKLLSNVVTVACSMRNVIWLSTTSKGGSMNLRRGGGPLLPAFLSLPSLPPPCTWAPLNQLGVWGSAVSSRAGSRTEPRPKTNLVRSKAARKQYTGSNHFEYYEYHVYECEEISCMRWCRHDTVPLSHIRSTVSDGVSPSPKGGWAGLAPSKSATA